MAYFTIGALEILLWFNSRNHHHTRCMLQTVPVALVDAVAIVAYFRLKHILLLVHWKFFFGSMVETTTTLFYDPFSGSTRVSRCQKKTSGL